MIVDTIFDTWPTMLPFLKRAGSVSIETGPDWSCETDETDGESRGFALDDPNGQRVSLRLTQIP